MPRQKTILCRDRFPVGVPKNAFSHPARVMDCPRAARFIVLGHVPVCGMHARYYPGEHIRLWKETKHLIV